jgi:hypothetical protein
VVDQPVVEVGTAAVQDPPVAVDLLYHVPAASPDVELAWPIEARDQHVPPGVQEVMTMDCGSPLPPALSKVAIDTELSALTELALHLSAGSWDCI